MFVEYEEAGIYRRHTNIVADQVVPLHRERSMVDTSEWLFSAALLRSIGFVADYSRGDWITCRTEDSKLLDRIVESGISVPSTRRPTLRYFLGGYSNNWACDGASIEGWL